MKFEREVNLKCLIGQFQQGFMTLSGSSSISSVAALLGVAGGFVLALRGSKFGILNTLHLEWLPHTETSSPEQLPLVPGLQNLGNNCFLNVILQALASCSCFQPFLQKVLEEYEFSAAGNRVDGFPLAIALATLLEDLCVVGGGRVVLSPRKVMLAMADYIQNFDLTSQQDAAEAFLHLVSSLREEFSDCYLPNQCSLAELCASNCRIITPKSMENQSKQARWQQYYLGPFDGILGSILTCQSCSSQISLNFESFHSLPLSPVLDGGGTIMVGCTLEDCLEQFTAAEQVENYHCNHCWHIAAVKYLFSLGVNEEEIEKIKRCPEQDSCDCRSHFHLHKLPWSNRFSYTLKQISIARCPKILCIHLKRVSVNIFGELVKLQGHISFPLVLDLLQFRTTEVRIKSWEENMKRGQVQRQCRNLGTFRNQSSMQHDQIMRNHIYGSTRGSIYPEELALDVSRFTANAQDFLGESSFSQAAGISKSMHADMNLHSEDQLTESCEVVPSNTSLYRVVAVVEHFGRAGSGHYTVYRSVRADLCEEPCDESEVDAAAWCWYSNLGESETQTQCYIESSVCEGKLPERERDRNSQVSPCRRRFVKESCSQINTQPRAPRQSILHESSPTRFLHDSFTNRLRHESLDRTLQPSFTIPSRIVLDVKKITLRNYKIYTEYTLMRNQYKTTTEFMPMEQMKHISSTTLTKTPRVRFMVSVI